jgi:hypothetical protein
MMALIATILADPAIQGGLSLAVTGGVTWCLKKLYDLDLRLTRLEQHCTDATDCRQKPKK